MYKTKRDDIIIARIEASINEQISMRYGIYSFPMVVLFFPKDQHVHALFQGKRVADMFDMWIQANAPALPKKLFAEQLEYLSW